LYQKAPDVTEGEQPHALPTPVDLNEHVRKIRDKIADSIL